MTEPLKAIGIATEHVGQPRNDGSRGSALYRVPVRLSRVPSDREARNLVAHWDNPGVFSTMHRRGITYVEDDLFVLDGTTVEEVRDTHAQTIKLAIEATNADEATAIERERAAREAAEAESNSHKANVEDVAKSIRFD